MFVFRKFSMPLRERIPSEQGIYVDASKQNSDTELGRLMHDLNCCNAVEMYDEILAERVHWLKETERGVEDMCGDMDEIRDEGIEEGIAKEKARSFEEKKKTARNLKKIEMPIEQIALVMDTDVKTVREWVAEELVPA